jgi:hypothetical protein
VNKEVIYIGYIHFNGVFVRLDKDPNGGSGYLEPGEAMYERLKMYNYVNHAEYNIRIHFEGRPDYFIAVTKAENYWEVIRI